MATELATAYISLVPSLKGAKGAIERDLGAAGSTAAASTERSFKAAAGKAGGHFKSALKVGVGAGLLGVAAGAGAIKSVVDAASNLDEARSKINAVFGPDVQKNIEDFAAKSATSLGQSKQQVLDAVGGYGNLLTSFGVDSAPAAEMSTSLTTLASDLASFNNTSVDDALAALQSGLTGETEPLKRYGVALDDASLKAKALAMGISDGKATLTPAAKAQASYALIMERTTNAQGDFARTSGGLANQQKIFKARFDNLKTSIGAGLLPVVNKLLPVLGGLFDKVEPLARRALPYLREAFEQVGAWWRENGPQIRDTAQQVFGRVSEVVLAVVGIVQKHWPQIQATISKVIATVRTVISGAVEFITVMWRNFGDNILNFVNDAWGPIQRVISGALDVIRGVIDTFLGIITGDWSRAWDGIKGIVTGALEIVTGAISLGWEAIKAAAGVAWELISSAITTGWTTAQNFISGGIMTIVDWFTGLPETIASAASGMWDGIGTAFKSAINLVISAWNSFEFPSKTFDIPAIPGLYDGGEFKIGGWKLPEISPLETHHTGGVISGPRGREVPILGLGGERVLSLAETAAYEANRGAGGGLHFNGAVTFGDTSGHPMRDLELFERRRARMVAVL